MVSDSINYDDDAHWDELAGVSQEGKPRKGKTYSMVSYYLMANLQNDFETWNYEEAKDILEWEK